VDRPGPFRGHTTGLCWAREGRSARAMARELEIRVPDGAGARSLAGFGNLMGRHFWVGCGCFFSWGVGGGEEELKDTTVEVFSQDDASPKQSCYVIYYMLSSGGFATHAFRSSRRVSSILESRGSARALFKLRQPVDLCHTS
jgi:hypothetical protein